MGLGFGGKKEGSCHVMSFLLGAALPTALLLFVVASDRLGHGLSGISVSWGNGTVVLPPAGGTPAHQKPSTPTGDGAAAPTPDQQDVTKRNKSEGNKLIFSTKHGFITIVCDPVVVVVSPSPAHVDNYVHNRCDFSI
jgi:hypothetical protein